MADVCHASSSRWLKQSVLTFTYAHILNYLARLTIIQLKILYDVIKVIILCKLQVSQFIELLHWQRSGNRHIRYRFKHYILLALLTRSVGYSIFRGIFHTEEGAIDVKKINIKKERHFLSTKQGGVNKIVYIKCGRKYMLKFSVTFVVKMTSVN